MTRISVVIPTFNYGRYLSRAIDSALAQDYPHVEVLVVDDGSTDDTASIVASYLNRVRYVFQVNQGQGAARNHGIRLASGDWILPLDADDALLSSACTRFAQAIAAHPTAELVFGGYVSRSEGGDQRRPRPGHILSGDRPRDFADFIFHRYAIPPSAACARRAALLSEPFPEDLRGTEDIVLCGRLLATRHCVSFSDPVVEMFAHAQRQRDNVTRLERDTPLLAARLFDGLPAHSGVAHLRSAFVRERQAELFRTHFRLGNYQRAAELGGELLRSYPAHLLSPRFCGKLLRAYWFARGERDQPATVPTSRTTAGPAAPHFASRTPTPRASAAAVPASRERAAENRSSRPSH